VFLRYCVVFIWPLIRKISLLCSNDRFVQYQDTFGPVKEVIENLSDAVLFIMSSRNMASGMGLKAMVESRRRAETKMYDVLEAKFDEHLLHADEHVLEKSSVIMVDGAERDASVSGIDRDGRSQLAGSETMVGGTGSGKAVPESGIDRDGGSQFVGSENMVGGTGSGKEVSVSETDRDDKSRVRAKKKREISASKRRDVDEAKPDEEADDDADDDVDDDDSDSDSDDDDDDDDESDDDDDDTEQLKIAREDGRDVEIRTEKRKQRKKRGGEDSEDTRKGKRKRVDGDTEVSTSKREKEAGKALEPQPATVAVQRRYRKIKASFRHVL